MKKEFPKQDSALQYAALDGDLSVFSWEIGKGGERKFLVCSKETFWNFYKNLERKHYYEVIPSTKPCKLYFDLEFLTEHNPEKDGYKMTESLVSMVNSKLKEEFSCGSFIEDVLILESSTATKFSVHLIFQKAIFPNNVDCGVFVKHFLWSLAEEERKMFQVKEQEGSLTQFIDLSVYTRNRNFRLYLSTKLGKRAQFSVSAIDVSSAVLMEEYSEKSADDLEWRIFCNSLISNVDQTASVISLRNVVTTTSTSTTRHERLPRCPEIKSSCSSPYPEIDNFVSELVYPGRIRQWRYDGQTESLLYDIGGNRYCSNVGRQHRSNHVYFTCQLSPGVLRQGCYDQGCAGYRGPQIFLPESCLAWARLQDWQGEEEEGEGDMREEDDQFLLEGSEGY